MNQQQFLNRRIVFGLKGTNISLPTRYKIRKHVVNESHSQTPPSQTFFARKGVEHLPPNQSTRVITDRRVNSEVTKLRPSKQSILQKYNKTIKNAAYTCLPQKQTVIERMLVQQQFRKDAHEQRQSLKEEGKYKNNINKGRRCACGDCQDCLKDFTYFLNLFSDDQSIPEISAKSWCVWRRRNNKFLHFYGKRIHKVRQIASLTKMITAMTAMDFLTKYSYDPQQIQFAVRKSALMVGGTTAQLQQNDTVTILDLLYGMMLPSGNDAAVVLSQVIGLLCFLKNKNKAVQPTVAQWYIPYHSKNYSYLFIGMMNEKCQRMGTLNTHMFNSHGNDAYDQLKNVSTCNEVARIAGEFMNYPLLRQVVRTTVRGNFVNTNKLLEDGFEGIKTGITDSAGPCLAAAYKDFIVVVLNSKSMNQRWIEVKKLVKWMLKKTL